MLEDGTDLSEREVLANMPILCPRCRFQSHYMIFFLKDAETTEIYTQVNAGNTVDVDGYILEPDEILVTSDSKQGYAVASESGYVVAVTTEITPELAMEGTARELVHRIQNMRRSAGFDIADYITTYYQGSEQIGEVIGVHGEYIRQETLSREISDQAPPEDAYSETQKIDGQDVVVGVVRAESD